MRIVVVGAGVSGLAAAHVLARTGHDVTLIDASPGPFEIGAGLLLQPNGIAVLDAIGVTDRLRPASSALRKISIFDGVGKPLATTTIPDFGGGLNEALLASRADISAALLATLPVIPHWDVTVGHATHGYLDVHTSKGHRTLHADLIVGADGASSAIRTAFGMGQRKRDGRRYLRALVEAECRISAAGEYWTRSGLAGVFPCGATRTYLFATATREIIDAHDSGEDMRAVVSAAHPILASYLPQIWPATDVLVNEVSVVDCPSFVAPGVALIGDAAHAMAPNLGQGANSGLVDAAVLALSLAGETDLDRALARYNSQRQSVKAVQRSAEQLARVAHVRGARHLRNSLTRMLSRAGGDAAIRRAQQIDPLAMRQDLQLMLSEVS